MSGRHNHHCEHCDYVYTHDDPDCDEPMLITCDRCEDEIEAERHAEYMDRRD